MNNKKGFTLVELLAVIVILAVVMLIATQAVLPLMSKARKGALGTEGLSLVDAAKSAFQAEQMNATTSSFSQTSVVCFSLQWLYANGYYEKGTGSDGYSGSVLVDYNSGSYTYNFWITNGTYTFGTQLKADGTFGSYNGESNTGYKYSDAIDGSNVSTNCGKTAATTDATIWYCYVSGTTSTCSKSLK